MTLNFWDRTFESTQYLKGYPIKLERGIFLYIFILRVLAQIIGWQRPILVYILQGQMSRCYRNRMLFSNLV